MANEKLIAHAERLHALACSQGASRHDLIQLRDLVPQLLDSLRCHSSLSQHQEPSAPTTMGKPEMPTLSVVD